MPNEASNQSTLVGGEESGTDADTREFWNAVRNQQNEGNGNTIDSLAETFQAVALSNPDMFAGLLDHIIVQQEQKVKEEKLSKRTSSIEKIKELRLRISDTLTDEDSKKTGSVSTESSSAVGEATQALRMVRRSLASNMSAASMLSKELDGVIQRSSSSYSITNRAFQQSSYIDEDEQSKILLTPNIQIMNETIFDADSVQEAESVEVFTTPKNDLGMNPTCSTHAMSSCTSSLENPTSASANDDETMDPMMRSSDIVLPTEECIEEDKCAPLKLHRATGTSPISPENLLEVPVAPSSPAAMRETSHAISPSTKCASMPTKLLKPPPSSSSDETVPVQESESVEVFTCPKDDRGRISMSNSHLLPFNTESSKNPALTPTPEDATTVILPPALCVKKDVEEEGVQSLRKAKTKGIPPVSPLNQMDTASTASPKSRASPLKIAMGSASIRLKLPPRSPSFKRATSMNIVKSPAKQEKVEGAQEANLKSYSDSVVAGGDTMPVNKDKKLSRKQPLRSPMKKKGPGSENVVMHKIQEDTASTGMVEGKKKANQKHLLRAPMRNKESKSESVAVMEFKEDTTSCHKGERKEGSRESLTATTETGPHPLNLNQHDYRGTVKERLGKIAKPSKSISKSFQEEGTDVKQQTTESQLSSHVNPQQKKGDDEIDVKVDLNESESSVEAAGPESSEAQNAGKIATPRSLRQRINVLAGRARPTALASKHSCQNNFDFETIANKSKPPPPSPSVEATQFTPSFLLSQAAQHPTKDSELASAVAMSGKLTSPKHTMTKRSLFSIFKGKKVNKKMSSASAKEALIEITDDGVLAEQMQAPNSHFKRVAQDMGVDLPSVDESNLTAEKTWEDFLTNFPTPKELADKIIGNIDTYDEERFSGSESATPRSSRVPYRDAFVEGTISYELGRLESAKSPMSTDSSIDTTDDDTGSSGLFEEFSESVNEITDWLSPRSLKLNPGIVPAEEKDEIPQPFASQSCSSDEGDETGDDGSAVLSFFFPPTPKSLA